MNHNKSRFGTKFRTLLILLALVVIGMGSTTLLSKSVTLVYDGQETLYNTTASTVEEFLKENEIEIEEYAYLAPQNEIEIINDMEIELISPKEIVVLDDGIEKTVQSGHITVKEVLEQHGYELRGNDYTVPGLEEELDFTQEENPVIIIHRVYHKTVSELVTVPYETITRENAQLEKGKTKIVTEGVNGSAVVTTAITLINDVEVKTHVVEEEVIEAPVNEVKEIGTKEPQPVYGGGAVNKQGGTINGMKVKRVITMEATAYDASPASNGKWAGITALGTNLRPGVVAVDRNVIPLGTKLYIESTDGWPSYGMAVAEDVGGAIKGNRIDLFFESANTVRKFGRRTVTVYVLEP